MQGQNIYSKSGGIKKDCISMFTIVSILFTIFQYFIDKIKSYFLNKTELVYTLDMPKKND